MAREQSAFASPPASTNSASAAANSGVHVGNALLGSLPPSKLKLLLVLRKPDQALADGEWRVFRELLFQRLELNQYGLELLFVVVVRLSREPSGNHFVESLPLSLPELNKRQPGGVLIHPLHIRPINYERPFPAWHIDAQL